FIPTPGLIRHWAMPSGEGVRVDTAASTRDRVPPEYDNLLAKVMAHAPDRDAALDRLADALAETEIAGIQTTLPFHRYVAGHAGFRAGELTTGWVGDHWDGPGEARKGGRLARFAAALAIATEDAAGDRPADPAGGRPATGPMESRLRPTDGVGGWSDLSDEPASWSEAALAAMADDLNGGGGTRRRDRAVRVAFAPGTAPRTTPDAEAADDGPAAAVRIDGAGRARVHGTDRTAILTRLGRPRARLVLSEDDAATESHQVLITGLPDPGRAALGVRRLEVVVDGWR